MKVKHTKLKKSIFLILICISLTTTFVVSASALDYSFSSSIYFCSNSSCNLVSDGIFYQRTLFRFIYTSQDIEYSGSFFPAGTCFVYLFWSVDDSVSVYHEFSFLGFPSYFIANDIRYDIEFQLVDPSFPGAYIYESSFIDFPLDPIPTVYIYSSDSPSFTDTVGSGLTSSLSWVGQVVESLTTGPIKPLLECFAVTISVSALLLGIYSIRRFIWGS